MKTISIYDNIKKETIQTIEIKSENAATIEYITMSITRRFRNFHEDRYLIVVR